MTLVSEPVAPASVTAVPRTRRPTAAMIVIGALIAVPLLFGLGLGIVIFTSHPRNPVIASDYADPQVVAIGGTYYAFGTGVGDVNLQVRSSTDLKHWKSLPDALPKLPTWAVGGQAWAPTVAKFGDTWVMYFSAAIDYSGLQCIQTATATNVEGPYTSVAGDPFLCQQALGGSIDPATYTEDGTTWFVWKSDGDHIGAPTAIWSQPLTADGLAFAPGSSATQLLTSTQPWQERIVEAPWMTRGGDDLLLFYSGGWYNTTGYAVAWARCSSPTGPCTPQTVDDPLVASRGDVAGPGSASIFTDAVGQDWIVYHAWTAPHVGYEHDGVRSMHIDRIDLRGSIPETPAPTGN